MNLLQGVWDSAARIFHPKENTVGGADLTSPDLATGKRPEFGLEHAQLVYVVVGKMNLECLVHGVDYAPHTATAFLVAHLVDQTEVVNLASRKKPTRKRVELRRQQAGRC